MLPLLVPEEEEEKWCRGCFFEHGAKPRLDRVNERLEQLEARQAEPAVARVLDKFETMSKPMQIAVNDMMSDPSAHAWKLLRIFLEQAESLLSSPPPPPPPPPPAEEQEEDAWDRNVQELRDLAHRLGALANALHAVADSPSVRSELVLSMDGYVTRARRLCMRATEPAFGVSERMRHLGCDPTRYDAKEIGRRALELFRRHYPGRDPARRFSAAGDYWFNVYTESECARTLDAAILGAAV
jgi:hypothetical protein